MPQQQIEDDVVQYRRLSPWAFLALGLGIVSALAIMGPLLWFIPVAGIVVSLVALKLIAASQEQVSGWNLALLGLVLAIFFGMAGPARTLSRQYWLTTRAQEYVQGFIDLLVHNKALAAYQLTVPELKRLPASADAADPYAKDPNAKKEYEKFLASAAVKALLAGGSQAKFDCISTTFLAGDEHADYLDVHFQVAFPGGESRPLDAHTIVGRNLAYDTGAEQWRIVPDAIRKAE